MGKRLGGHTERLKRITDFNMRVITDYLAGIPVPVIAKRYRNPVTRKAYSRQQIYFIIRKLKNSYVN